MSKYNLSDTSDESHPGLEALYKRVLGWREEIGIKTYPDMRQFKNALEMIREAGIEEDLVLFVVGLCEWTFRIKYPLPLHIRRALRLKLNKAHYSPYGPTSPFLAQIRPSPPLIDQYIDSRLGSLWNENASEQSRVLLGDRIERLVRDFSKPFQVAGFIEMPPKRGGYSWQAPWVAGAVIYEWLRKLHPKKRDSLALEAALTLVQALSAKMPDQSQFHRKRRELLRIKPDFPQWFTARYKNFMVAHKLTIPELLDPNFEISTFTVVL